MDVEIGLAVAFAALVVAPVGLRALGTPAGLPLVGSLAGVALSLLLPFGPVAALLVLPWLGFAAWLAFLEARTLVRTFSDGGRLTATGSLEVLARSALVVGAGWLLISRMGWRPLSFPSAIVALTGVHFHVAGFGGLTLATRLAARARTTGTKAISAVAGFAAALGIGLVAVGITAPPLTLPGLGVLQPLGGTLTGIAFFTIAILEVRLGAGARPWFVAGLIALPVGMALAIGYATAAAIGMPGPSIGTMLAIHGVANGVGFVLCGLIGWIRLEGRHA